MTDKSISFSPDQDFEEKVNTGDASTTTIKDFLKNYDRVKLGIEDAEEIGREILGLYWDAEGKAHLTEKDGSDEMIDTNIDLGESGKGKLLVVCEKGIENTVRELADDDGNHLPATKTGVVVHYVIEGIARDFGITFNRQPVSIGGFRGRGGKGDRDAGVIRLSKQEKNEILEKLDMTYYQDDITSGKITRQDAFAMIDAAYTRKEEWEKQGYFLSPNKTEGVLLYNWKKEIDDAWSNECPNGEGSAIYSKHKVEVLIPNVFENYYKGKFAKANQKNTNHLLKTKLASTLLNLKKFGIKREYGAFASENEVTSEKEILELIGFDKKGTVMGVHIAKLKQSGMMKPRYVVVDVLDGGKQVLYLYDKSGVTTFS